MNERAGAAWSDVAAVRALGEQFDELGEHANEPRLARGGPKRRYAAILAFAAGLLAAAAAGAATGVLPVGSVLRGEGFDHDTPGTNQSSRDTDETVVASGTAPVAGRWQLTTFVSRETRTADGRVIEPAGLTCLKLRLLGPQAGRYGGGGFCGDTSDFTATFRAQSDPSSPGEVLVFGWAPEGAAAVELRAEGADPIRAKLQRPDEGGPSYFLIAAPPGLEDARIDWVGRDGKEQPGRGLSNAFSSSP